MPNSMTGFARAEVKEEWGTVTCELKTVNHRFLDMYFRLPESLRAAESDFRNHIKSALTRGKLECSFQVQTTSTELTAATIDLDAAKIISSKCDEIAAQMKSFAPVSPLEIMQMPGVALTQSTENEKIAVAANAALIDALEKLSAIRAREGSDMADVISRRVDAMFTQLSDVTEALPQIRTQLEQRLRDRLAELQLDAQSERVEQEVVLLAQKMDVDEETDRLKTHLEEINRVLKSDKPIGRRLDFLMQELNREANTLASKSQAVESTNVAVEMKVLIEQMREQIQNIE